MPRLPAFCSSCGAIYPSPLGSSGPAELTALDVPVPCPRCGESGHVPVEVYRRTRDLLAVLTKPQTGAELRSGLREVALEAREEPPAPEDLRYRVGRLGPEAEAVVSLLPRDAEDVRPFSGLLLAAVETAGEAAPDPPEPAALVESAFRRAVDRYGHRPEPSGDPSGAEARRGAGRNEPCPCGSGEKYKDCHWVEDQRELRSDG